MLTNATLVSVTSPAVPNSSGGSAPGSTSSKGVRCMLDQPTGRALLGARAVHVDTTAVAYVPIDDAAGIVEKGHATFLLDGESTNRVYRVLTITTNVKLGLSHKVVHLGSK